MGQYDPPMFFSPVGVVSVGVRNAKAPWNGGLTSPLRGLQHQFSRTRSHGWLAMGYMTTPLRGCNARRAYGEGFLLDGLAEIRRMASQPWEKWGRRSSEPRRGRRLAPPEGTG